MCCGMGEETMSSPFRRPAVVTGQEGPRLSNVSMGGPCRLAARPEPRQARIFVCDEVLSSSGCEYESHVCFPEAWGTLIETLIPASSPAILDG